MQLGCIPVPLYTDVLFRSNSADFIHITTPAFVCWGYTWKYSEWKLSLRVILQMIPSTNGSCIISHSLGNQIALNSCNRKWGNTWKSKAIKETVSWTQGCVEWLHFWISKEQLQKILQLSAVPRPPPDETADIMRGGAMKKKKGYVCTEKINQR